MEKDYHTQPQFHLRMPKGLKRLVEREAARVQVSASAWMRTVLEKELDRLAWMRRMKKEVKGGKRNQGNEVQVS